MSTVNRALLEEMLGPVKFKDDLLPKTDLVGVVNGLAWTSVGGELLQVEAVTMDGSGKLELTGSLGDVMKESAKAAHSYVRAVAARYKIDPRVFKERDIHIHVPQGAVGWSVRRRHHGNGAAFRTDRPPGTQRCGDDRRNLADRPGDGDRRAQRKEHGRL